MWSKTEKQWRKTSEPEIVENIIKIAKDLEWQRKKNRKPNLIIRNGREDIMRKPSNCAHKFSNLDE